MKTFLVLITLFFIWQLWDIISVGRGGAAERIRKDEKYKMKTRTDEE